MTLTVIPEPTPSVVTATFVWLLLTPALPLLLPVRGEAPIPKVAVCSTPLTVHLTPVPAFHIFITPKEPVGLGVIQPM